MNTSTRVRAAVKPQNYDKGFDSSMGRCLCHGLVTAVLAAVAIIASGCAAVSPIQGLTTETHRSSLAERAYTDIMRRESLKQGQMHTPVDKWKSKSEALRRAFPLELPDWFE